MISVYYEGVLYILFACKLCSVQVLNSIQLLVSGKNVENDQLATSFIYIYM